MREIGYGYRRFQEIARFTGGPPDVLTVCAACGEPVRAGELTVSGGTHPVEGDPW